VIIINLFLHLIYLPFLILGVVSEFAIQRFKHGREIAKILMKKLDKTA